MVLDFLLIFLFPLFFPFFTPPPYDFLKSEGPSPMSTYDFMCNFSRHFQVLSAARWRISTTNCRKTCFVRWPRRQSERFLIFWSHVTPAVRHVAGSMFSHQIYIIIMTSQVFFHTTFWYQEILNLCACLIIFTQYHAKTTIKLQFTKYYVLASVVYEIYARKFSSKKIIFVVTRNDIKYWLN